MSESRFATLTWVVAVLWVGRCVQAQQTYTQTVENTPGLLAYYQFSGTTNSSVNGHTGTLTTGASIDALGSGPALADDPSNQALKLDGTNGNELISSLSSGVSTAGSIVAWFKLSALPSTAGRNFYIAGESAPGNDFDVQIQSDDRVYFYTDSGGHVASPTPLSAADLGNWFFIAATFTASSDRTLYINNVAVDTNTPGSHTDSGNAFTIGYSNVFGGRSFQGDIDEVAFYNRDLSASEVDAIYASRLVVPEPCTFLMAGWAALVLLAKRRRRGMVIRGSSTSIPNVAR
ncbi:MAG TPA: LamG domain-containing protein [Tepidisphaeraceae bacterium]|jgi:hypothetical protein|nr:LamG domain-containing protein [Tepidisphaeraceae bacterium]